MRLRMNSRLGLGWRAAMVTATVLIAFASPASASDIFTIDEVDSPDPVPRGQTVTDTFTITNSEPGCGDCGGNYAFDMLLLRSKSDASVPNPFLTVTSSYGSCSIDPVDSYGYHSAICNLGARQNIPQTVTVVATIEANESFDNYAGFLETGEPIGIVSNALTQVIYPPAISGSGKIRLKGVPQGCATDDFKVKARARAGDIGRFTAILAGPRDEWGARLDDGFSKKIAHSEGSSHLKAKVRASKLDAGFYDLGFAAIGKGHPTLKSKVNFQVCDRSLTGAG